MIAAMGEKILKVYSECGIVFYLIKLFFGYEVYIKYSGIYRLFSPGESFTLLDDGKFIKATSGDYSLTKYNENNTWIISSVTMSQLIGDLYFKSSQISLYRLIKRLCGIYER